MPRKAEGERNPVWHQRTLIPYCGSGGVIDYIATNVLNCDLESSESMSTKHIFIPVGVVHYYKGDHSYKGKSLRHRERVTSVNDT